PAGGQEYCFKQQQTITWVTSGGTVSTVSIYLMQSDGQTINRTIASNISNNGSYLWNGFATDIGNYLIKISGTDDATPTLITGQTGVFTLKDCEKPDLQVGVIKLLPQNPGERQNVKFEGYVMNYGENPVENPVVMLKIKRSTGTTIRTFTEELDITLLKNQGILYVKEFRAPRHGSYTATFILDAVNGVDEMNENNNEKNKTFIVRPLADLIVCISNAKRPPVGRSREIRMVVKNIGNFRTSINPVSGIKLRSYVEAKGVKMHDIPPLEPGESFTIKRNHKWGLAGTKTLTAKIIYPGDETNSRNNEVQSSFFVRLPHHDTYSAAYKVKCSTGQDVYNWDDIEN
ncbi:MAG: hypothetical protein KJO39_08290, partial [Bacteroidia bacterium]|nr:hypothetical protein [Bacteroidia bacterium]NNF32327.1 hypothetical protein [Flavobacteriaceae bacterium]NNK53953.1 hypothetical protein [Flavobacteriaceae bacterium]NNM09874.1 hypothetical protein [Flavobacteriaceae bacterium]